MNWNLKRFIVYAVFMVLVGITIIFLAQYSKTLEHEANVTFNLLPLLIFGAFQPILIGMLLKIPSLILNWRKTEWGFDWIKFLSIGLISLFFATNYVRFHLNLDFDSLTPYYYYSSDHLRLIFGVVFGYVLLSCIRYNKTEV